MSDIMRSNDHRRGIVYKFNSLYSTGFDHSTSTSTLNLKIQFKLIVRLFIIIIIINKISNIHKISKTSNYTLSNPNSHPFSLRIIIVKTLIPQHFHHTNQILKLLKLLQNKFNNHLKHSSNCLINQHQINKYLTN